jgi:hypothetical protein
MVTKMTFDPNSVTPPDELLDEWQVSRGALFDDYITAARWGAAQAVEALKHQWPEPITNRPPTEADGDDRGYVQVPEDGLWVVRHWKVAGAGGKWLCPRPPRWLHAPGWHSKPELTLKQQGLDIVDTMSRSDEITISDAEILRAALALIPGLPGDE